jgi:hypothetical protein
VVAITDIAGGGNDGFYFVVVSSLVLDVGVWVSGIMSPTHLITNAQGI